MLSRPDPVDDCRPQDRQRSSPLSWIALLSIALPSSGLLAGCGEGAPGAGGAVVPPSKAPRAMPVSTAPVQRGELRRRVEGTGSLEAYQVVTVAARVEGVVESVDVDEGDSVGPTKILAVIDGRRRELERLQAQASRAEASALGPKVAAAAARAQAGVERAQAQERVARTDLAEAEALLARRQRLGATGSGVVPPEEIQIAAAQVARRRDEIGVAEAAHREADAALEQAKADEALARQTEATAQARLDLAAKIVEDTVVKAPISGVVRRRAVTLGQYVRAGDPLVEIVDRSRLRVRFRVTEAESVLLAKDQPLTFRVPSLSDEEHAGVLVHVDETASPVSRMVECLGEVKDPGTSLKPGFFVVASVERTAADVLHVPEDALLPGDQGWIAFVVTDGVARRRVLRLGLRSRDGKVEVLDGLKEGEALIVKGARIVSEGQAVAVAEAPAPQPPSAPRR